MTTTTSIRIKSQMNSYIVLSNHGIGIFVYVFIIHGSMNII